MHASRVWRVLMALLVALPLLAVAPDGASARPEPPEPSEPPVEAEAEIPPPLGEDPGATPVGGFVEGESVEVVEERTEYSKTFENPDGTESRVIALVPMHFDDGDGWADIDTSVSEVPGDPGVFESGANEWTARFAPLPEGVTIETDGGSVEFSPVDAGAVVPEPLESGDGVVYRDAWPGVDLRYTVTADAVKEDIVLREAPSRDHFDFRTGGRVYSVVDGLLRPLLGGDALGALLPAEAIDAAGESLSEGAVSVRPLFPIPLVRPATLRVGFDRDYIAGLPESAYPVVVDPTWSAGSSNMHAYKSDGAHCGGCGLKVGNTVEPAGNRYWRSVGYFDYAPLFGRTVTNATLTVGNRQFGTANPYTLRAYWASAYSYAGAPGVGPYASASVGNSVTLGGANLTALYNYFTTNSVSGGALGFLGQQSPGVYTYKSFAHFVLTLTYAATPPSAPRNVTAVDNHDSTVTVSWTPPSSNGGSTVTGYRMRLWNAGDDPAVDPPRNSSTCSGSCSQRTWVNFAEGGSRFFGVSAINSAGEGPIAYSNTFTVAIRPGAPDEVIAHAGNGQALVTWPGASTNGGPPIDSYSVGAYHPTNPNLNKTAVVCGWCRQHTFEGLQNGVEYVIGVRAHNPNGFGNEFTTATVTPAANPAPYPPVAQAASGGDGEAMITWNAPAANGGAPVESFVVQAFQGETFVAQHIVAAGGFHNRHRWTGLANNTTYTFHVYAYNGSAVSTPAITGPATPSANPAPYPPRNPATTAGAGTVLVAWQAPEAGPAPTGYLVAAYSTTEGFVAQQETLTGLDTVTLFAGLDQAQSYIFAIYSSGPGGFSAPIVTAPATPIGGNLLIPTDVQASRGDTEIDVSWTPPTVAIDGVTSYTATAYRADDDTVAGTATTTDTSTTIDGLINGTPVYVKVVATNLILPGPASAPSNTVTPAGPPFAPEDVTAERGDTEISVTWDPPSVRADGTPGNNGDPITEYEILTYRADDDSPVSTTTATASPATVDGLTNGTGYYAIVRAINTVATGENSDPSNEVIPAGVPFPPVNVAAVHIPGTNQALVSWDPPPAQPDGTPGNNGDPIATYTITSSGGQTTAVGASERQAVVDDLVYGTGYTFSVVATNGVGPGLSSAPSNEVTPAGRPFPPENVTATSTSEGLRIAWDPPSDRADGTPGDNGSAIEFYTVTRIPGGDEVTSSSTSVLFAEGVQEGTTYRFVVSATNDRGTSDQSDLSNEFTPQCSGQPPCPGAPLDVQASAGPESATVAWDLPEGGATLRFRIVGTPDVGTVLTSPGETSHTFGNLTNWTEYSFTVESVNGETASNPVATTPVTPKPTRARDLVSIPADATYAYFDIPTWRGHGTTRLQGFIDDTDGELVCLGPEIEPFCGLGDGRSRVDSPEEIADYDISARARLLLDHEYGEGTIISYATHDADGNSHAARAIEVHHDSDAGFDGWPNEVALLTQGEFEGTATVVYHLINSVTPEELARSGAPAINGAIKVSKGENGAVRVKIGYRPFPSFELIRDLNGQSTLAWYNDQDGGPERLLFPAETVEFDA